MLECGGGGNFFPKSTEQKHLVNKEQKVSWQVLTKNKISTCKSKSPASRGGQVIGHSMPLKHVGTTQAFVPEDLLNHCEGLRCTSPKIGTKSDAHSLFLSLIHRENRHKSRTRLQTNACENFPPPPSYELRATWHNDSLDMVVLPSTGASLYHNCCIDGGTSLENIGYHLVYALPCQHPFTYDANFRKNPNNTLYMLRPLYSHYTLIHVSALKGPSSGILTHFMGLVNILRVQV
jgi:hypothetical protein